MQRRTSRVAATVVLAAGGLAGTAQAGTNQVTYGTPGALETLVVPSDAPALHLVAVGGAGGHALGGAVGGRGARVTGTLQQPAGTTLLVQVGADGAPGALGAGAGGAPTSVRRSALGSDCSPGDLSTDTLLVAGAGGGAGTAVGGLAVGGDGGDAGAPGDDGNAVGSGGQPTGAGGTGDGAGAPGQTTSCPAGGQGGASPGAGGQGAPATLLGDRVFGGAGGDGDGGGGGGGGGVVGGGGGGGSDVGTGGGGAGGSSTTGLLSNATRGLAAGPDWPSLVVSWQDTLAPAVDLLPPSGATSRPVLEGTVSTGLGDPTEVVLTGDGPSGDFQETVTVVRGVWLLSERELADGAWTFTARAVDGGGNAAVDTEHVVLDTTPDEVCNGADDDGDGQVDEGVTQTWYADADGDGRGDPATAVQACPPGPDGHVLDGTDDDDRPASAEPAFVLGAFGRPIEAGEANAVTAGRAVPVKLRVVDDQGRPVTTDPGLRLTSAPVACGAGEPDPAAAATTGPGTWVHTGDGVWQLDWKTQRAWAGTCRAMAVDVAGDTAPAREARFAFR